MVNLPAPQITKKCASPDEFGLKMTSSATTGATTNANSNEHYSILIFILVTDSDALCSVSIETVSGLCICCWWRRIAATLPFSDGSKALDSWWIRRVIKRLGGKRWTGAGHLYGVKAAKSQNTLQVCRVVSVYLSACVFSLGVCANPNADGAWQSEIEKLRNSCISVGNLVSYLPSAGSLGLHVKLQGWAKSRLFSLSQWGRITSPDPEDLTMSAICGRFQRCFGVTIMAEIETGLPKAKRFQGYYSVLSN